MKKVILTICFLCLGIVNALAQVPNQGGIPKTMSYQAIIRNGNQGLVANGNITVRISIIKGSEFGTPAYVETHSTKTNANGLATLQIGGGSVLFGSFASIDWSSGPYFLRTETDPLGGSEYGITSVSPILTIPYAMHALRALNADSVKVEKDPVFTSSLASKITSDDTAKWNNKIEIEEDPVFRGSIAYTLNDSIVSRWDSSIVKELDPLFATSAASAITDTMINRWDSSIVEELDPVFTAWDKDYADLTNKPVTDGSETKIQAGRNMSISGSGTTASPYIIASGAGITTSTIDGSNTISIPTQVTVANITSNNDGNTDVITLPTGADGQILYVIFTGTDSFTINGSAFTTEKKFTYVYASGWQLMSAR
jgi:hypothetical protein